MSSTTILELRQADSNSVRANGDYETTLSKNIIINDGDVLALKSAYIDSKVEGNIVITSDTTLTIGFIPYITDWFKTADKTDYFGIDNLETVVDTTNGLDFIPYYFVPGGVIPGYSQITGFEYNYNTNTPDDPNSITATYSYENLIGQTISFHTTILKSSLQDEFGTYIDPMPNIAAKNGTFKATTSQAVLDLLYLTKREEKISPNPVEANTWEPYVFNTSILIEAGSYSPDYLSLVISERLSKNNANNAQKFIGLAQSPFLKSSSAYDVGEPYPNGISGLINTEGTVFISTNGSLRFKIASGKYYYIGTSQIALEYDQSSDKMNWAFTHFPMYDDTSASNICVRYQYYDSNSDNPAIASSKNGGIYFTSLTSTDASGNVTNFWEDVLGFNVAKTCVNPHQGYTQGTLNLTGSVQTVQQPIYGQNMTQGFYGLDSVVLKKANKFFLEPILSDNDDILCSTIDNTVNIEADVSIGDLINKYSHYIIETNVCFGNDFTGVNYNHNINGIISKYYSDNNFTFGDESGSIEYQHRGQPIFVKSIRVRILQSDKTLDPELGPDNTVFFQVIKQVPVFKPISPSLT
jgi:hypothetical protein